MITKNRKIVIQFIFVFIAFIFLFKLFIIQVVDSKYAKAANSNIINKVVKYPYRGIIFDRNGKLMVYNSPLFNLMVTPKNIKSLDTTKFCKVFNLSKKTFKEKIQKAKSFSYVKPSVFIKMLSNEDLAKVQDFIVDFKGFFIEARTTRTYTKPVLSNSLGYVSEITKRQLEIDNSNYYRLGDYKGQSGIEAYYESYLRGIRGVEYKIKNVDGVEKGDFENGKFDTLAIPGKNLTLSVDLALQEYGENLMNEKSGSIVAIEPNSGEILSLISSPSYNPNLLTGKNYSQNYYSISKDSLKPLFNRALMAQYRPGSIFKIVQSLVALEQGVINKNTYFACRPYPMKCHFHGPGETLIGAITNSCNPYFYNVMKRMIVKNNSKNVFIETKKGLNDWQSMVNSFGLGNKLGVDLPNEKGGLIPNANYYDNAYKNKPWKFSNIYSLSIGEGENLVVPLQMANLAAIIANRGYYYIPHLVKAIGDSKYPLAKFREKHHTNVSAKNFEIAVEAMENVINNGTGQYRAKLNDIVVCGKTGTVQNGSLADHSVFIAFAPKVSPKIAVAVYVENQGQGARAAASIASLMIEKYLLGETQRPQIEEYVKIGNFLD